MAARWLRARYHEPAIRRQVISSIHSGNWCFVGGLAKQREFGRVEEAGFTNMSTSELWQFGLCTPRCCLRIVDTAAGCSRCRWWLAMARHDGPGSRWLLLSSPMAAHDLTLRQLIMP
eukprot:349855-Chlamydomonas_euryale.AAC.8